MVGGLEHLPPDSDDAARVVCLLLLYDDSGVKTTKKKRAPRNGETSITDDFPERPSSDFPLVLHVEIQCAHTWFG